MKNVIINSVVTKPDGFYFSERYEMRNLPPAAGEAMSAQFDAFKALANAVNGPSGSYTGILSVTVDGAVQPDVVAHMSKAEFHKIQRTTHAWGGELLAKAQAK